MSPSRAAFRAALLTCGSLLWLGFAPPAEADCGPSDPAGLYKGTVSSSQAGKLDVTLNLRCDSGHYAGLIITPVGKFELSAGTAADGKLHLTFGEGAGAITAELERRGGALAGAFVTSDDKGPMALERVSGAIDGDPTAIRLNLTAEQWRQDLAFFAEQMRTKHGAPFHRVSRAAFDRAVAALAAMIGSLDPDAVYVELDRLATMIGDGHTFVIVPPDPAQMPLVLRRFGNEYRVAATTPEHRNALGAVVTAINDVPIARAVERALGPTPGDETLALRKDRTAYFLSLGMMLHGLGITAQRDVAAYRLRFDDGRKGAETMKAVAPGTPVDWAYAAAKQPLFRQHVDQSFWCSPLQEGRTVYCNFAGYDDLRNRAAELFRLIGSTGAKRAVVDLRLNTGGDFNEGQKYVIDPLARDPQINRDGGLYVLIGRSVFSAGMSNAAQFRAATHAKLIGEAIGERPNSWQEAREFTLPNSHLVVRYSTKFYTFAPRGENLIAPDVSVAPDWAEYARGEDPVLDWVLKQPLH